MDIAVDIALNPANSVESTTMAVTLPDTTDDNWVPELNFGDRLVVIRRHLDENVETLAARCGLSPSTWYSWENGAQPRGQADIVARIAQVTNVDRNWLMWGSAYSACLMHEMSPDLLGDGGVHQEALFEVQMPIAS